MSSAGEGARLRFDLFLGFSGLGALAGGALTPYWFSILKEEAGGRNLCIASKLVEAAADFLGGGGGGAGSAGIGNGGGRAEV